MGSCKLAFRRVFTMSFDTYTQNISLTQKARFWTNYISALKGQEGLCAGGEGESLLYYPSVWETVPSECKDLKKEIGKIEDQICPGSEEPLPLLQSFLTLMTRLLVAASPMNLCTLRSTEHSRQELQESLNQDHISTI